MNVLLIDNYDSFTYNLYQYLEELGCRVKVFRSDSLTPADIAGMNIGKIVISPGPGRPENAGICLDVVKHFYQRLPILGVCLGHQVIVESFGGIIARAEKIMHGKTSLIYHNNRTIYKGVANPFVATRYHSLIAQPDSLPPILQVNAWTKDREIMGVKVKGWPCYGIQYHPESILTVEGKKILGNFLSLQVKFKKGLDGDKNRSI